MDLDQRKLNSRLREKKGENQLILHHRTFKKLKNWQYQVTLELRVKGVKG